MINYTYIPVRLKVILPAIVSCLVLFISNATAETVITVKLSPLSKIATYPERTAPATVISLNESTVSARISAQVDALPVKVGDIVDKDSILAELDCTDYVLALRESKARLDGLAAQIDLAKRRLERTKKLTLKKSVSEEILDERESDLAVLNTERRAAKASLEMAKIEQSRCKVTSPFRALIVERSSAVGEYTNIGTALVKLMDIEQLEISAQVFSQDTEQISLSDELYFEHNSDRYPLSLRTVVPTINPETRNREVRLLFTSERALPGTAGKLVWRDKRPHIPGEYLIRRNDKLGVFTINNNIAEFIPVPDAQAGRASPTDLTIETPIVIEGHFSLKQDDAVKVSN